MADDLATISALWAIHEFDDYEPLIELVEQDSPVVMQNPTTRSIVIGLLRGKKLGSGLDGKKTGRKRSLFERDKVLIEFFNIYVTLGFAKYNSEDDGRIKDGKIPSSTAMVKLYNLYNRQSSKTIPNFKPLAYDSIKKIVLKSTEKATCTSWYSKLAVIYWIEKDNINISKLKENVQGTFLDLDLNPEFWEELDPDVFGRGDKNK